MLYNFSSFPATFHSTIKNRHIFLPVFTGNLPNEGSTVSLYCEHMLRVSL